jgi:exosortase C (VPDSG-CTERM-specific)
MTSNSSEIEPLRKRDVAANVISDCKALRMFQAGAVLVVAAFALPLWHLVQLAVNSDIHSHTLLIPLIVAYLWRKSPGPKPFARSAVDTESHSTVSKFIAVMIALIGIAGYAGSWWFGRTGRLDEIDTIALSITAFVLCAFALALGTMGWATLRPRMFAICFSLFFIPLPGFAVEAFSVALQKGSAEVADIMMRTTGMPVLRDDLVFKLPTLTIRVAEECSGIRSTFVLFMTSLLAGHVFLRAGWKKVLLALVVLPLGILRNAFRITTLGWLSVNVDSGIIDSPLHHHGGPIFFVLSLLPLFVLLWLFRRSDLQSSKQNRKPIRTL